MLPFIIHYILQRLKRYKFTSRLLPSFCHISTVCNKKLGMSLGTRLQIYYFMELSNSMNRGFTQTCLVASSMSKMDALSISPSILCMVPRRMPPVLSARERREDTLACTR